MEKNKITINVEDLLLRVGYTYNGIALSKSDKRLDLIKEHLKKTDELEKVEYFQFCLDLYILSELEKSDKCLYEKVISNNQDILVDGLVDKYELTYKNKEYNDEMFIEFLLEVFTPDISPEKFNVSFNVLNLIPINDIRDLQNVNYILKQCFILLNESCNIKEKDLTKNLFNSLSEYLLDLQDDNYSYFNLDSFIELMFFLKKSLSESDLESFLKPHVINSMKKLSEKVNDQEANKRMVFLGLIVEHASLYDILKDDDYVNKFVKLMVQNAVNKTSSGIEYNSDRWQSLVNIRKDINNSNHLIKLGKKDFYDYSKFYLYEESLKKLAENVNNIYPLSLNFLNYGKNNVRLIVDSSVPRKQELINETYNMLLISNVYENNLNEVADSIFENFVMKENLNKIPSDDVKKNKVKKF